MWAPAGTPAINRGAGAAAPGDQRANGRHRRHRTQLQRLDAGGVTQLHASQCGLGGTSYTTACSVYVRTPEHQYTSTGTGGHLVPVALRGSLGVAPGRGTEVGAWVNAQGHELLTSFDGTDSKFSCAILHLTSILQLRELPMICL